MLIADGHLGANPTGGPPRDRVRLSVGAREGPGGPAPCAHPLSAF